MNLEEARDALSTLPHGRERPGRILLEHEGRVAHLRIDNPKARGAITIRMMVELAEAVIALRRSHASLIVLSSTDPRAFCAGGHLGDVSRAVDSPEAAERMARAMSALLDAFADLPVPSVAAIDGAALGGGAELATACDWRVAGPEARLHFVQARLGIAPGWGGAGRLVRLVGRRTALRILTGARSLASGEAATLGLVDHRCDGAAVLGALAWLDDLLALPPAAVRAVKDQVVAASPTRPYAVDDEARAFAAVWGGPAHRDALVRLERHRR